MQNLYDTLKSEYEELRKNPENTSDTIVTELLVNRIDIFDTSDTAINKLAKIHTCLLELLSDKTLTDNNVSASQLSALSAKYVDMFALATPKAKQEIKNWVRKHKIETNRSDDSMYPEDLYKEVGQVFNYLRVQNNLTAREAIDELPNHFTHRTKSPNELAKFYACLTVLSLKYVACDPDETDAGIPNSHYESLLASDIETTSLINQFLKKQAEPTSDAVEYRAVSEELNRLLDDVRADFEGYIHIDKLTPRDAFDELQRTYNDYKLESVKNSAKFYACVHALTHNKQITESAWIQQAINRTPYNNRFDELSSTTKLAIQTFMNNHTGK